MSPPTDSTGTRYAPTVEGLVQAELGLDAPPRAGGADWLVHPPRDLIGLALSGGGIRSATYNLGLVQGLQRLGLLDSFDYVSTVSGGGYLGGFWSAWRKRKGGGVFPKPAAPATGREADEIRHLREFGNFLSPRMGLFSYDTGRMLVATLGGMVPSLLAALSLLVLVFAVWGGGASLLFDLQQGWTLQPREQEGAWMLVSVTFIFLLGFEMAWWDRGERSFDAAYWTAVAASVVMVGTGWVVAARWRLGSDAAPVQGRLPFLVEGALPTEWLVLLLPAAVWGAALLTFLFTRFLLSRFARHRHVGEFRAALDRASSRLLFLAVAWTVLATLWCAGVIAAHLLGARSAVVSGGSIALAVWVQTRLQKFAAGSRTGPSLPRLSARVKALLPRIVAYPILAAIAAGCVVLLAVAHRVEGVEIVRLTPYNALLLLAAVVTVLTAVLYQPEQVGLHAFYRARLARAFLGASCRRKDDGRGRLTEEDPEDDLALSTLLAGTPVHLVCCAANDLAPSDPLAAFNRGACSAVLSRVGFSVGNRWARWPDEAREVPTLGSAITASGAAFNSNMGSKSVYFGPAATFLMAAFGLRLGLWLAHPDRRERKDRTEARTWSRSWRLVGLPFYKELLGITSATGGDVHLSDGAHFENTAVYELIRRHCRVIVASDCGQDGERAFDDVGSLVRRVRIDFGVDVRIDLTPLKPGPDGHARQHMVAGDIHYPDGDTGVLLLFKPTLVGSEPADVAQYRTRNEAFPHQTTLDQFYDEAQWEAYRRLGEHAALTALRAVAEGVERVPVPAGQDEARVRIAAVFSAARREWLATPEGVVERLPRYTDGVAALDELLRQPGCATLLREVYPEVAALERANGRIWVPKLFGAQPATATDGQDRTGTPTGAAAVAAPDDPAATLHAVRRGLTFLYEVYRCEELERHYSHPVYLGVMNYAARWTSAPLVAFWWPLLKATFPLPFTRFLEGRLGLAGCRDRTAKVVAPAGAGYARRAWEQEGRGVLDEEGVTALAYEKEMSYEGGTVLTAQLAVIRAREAGASLVWDADDLYVPPGLWGIGIGGDFVRQLAEQAGERMGWDALIVRVPAHPQACPTEKKTVADALQLYRSYGFRETCAAELPDGITGGPDVQWMILSLARTGEASTARKEMGEPVGA